MGAAQNKLNKVSAFLRLETRNVSLIYCPRLCFLQMFQEIRRQLLRKDRSLDCKVSQVLILARLLKRHRVYKRVEQNSAIT